MQVKYFERSDNNADWQFRYEVDRCSLCRDGSAGAAPWRLKISSGAWQCTFPSLALEFCSPPTVNHFEIELLGRSKLRFSSWNEASRFWTELCQKRSENWWHAVRQPLQALHDLNRVMLEGHQRATVNRAARGPRVG